MEPVEAKQSSRYMDRMFMAFNATVNRDVRPQVSQRPFQAAAGKEESRQTAKTVNIVPFPLTCIVAIHLVQPFGGHQSHECSTSIIFCNSNSYSMGNPT